MKKLKIGVFGTGHLGSIHLKCLRNIPDRYELVGFYDPDKATAERVSNEYSATAFETPEKLLQSVDVVDIVAPTTEHYKLIGDAFL